MASRDSLPHRTGTDSRKTAVRRTPAGFSGYFLFLVGLGLTALGLGLIQPPPMIPHAEWIATKLARLGVQGMPFVAAGPIVFCLGFVARLQARVGRALAGGPDSEVAPEVARLTDQLAQVRGALGNVQTELLANKQRQDSMLEAIRTLTTADKGNEGNSNAMFRLAASLDQLGARIEERLRSQGRSFEERLGDVTTTVVRAQQEVTHAVDQVETRLAGFAQELERLGEVPTHAASEFTSQDDDFGWQDDDTTTESEDDLHVFVELEEEFEEPAPEPVLTHDAPMPAPAEDDNGSPLGILDALDDFGTVRERTTNERSNEGASLRMAGEPNAPLPQSQPQAAPRPQRVDPLAPNQQNWPPRPE